MLYTFMFCMQFMHSAGDKTSPAEHPHKSKHAKLNRLHFITGWIIQPFIPYSRIWNAVNCPYWAINK